MPAQDVKPSWGMSEEGRERGREEKKGGGKYSEFSPSLSLCVCFSLSFYLLQS